MYQLLVHFIVTDELISLLLTLLKIDTSVVVENHIPILLSAYELSLSVRDQQILKVTLKTHAHTFYIYENVT